MQIKEIGPRRIRHWCRCETLEQTHVMAYLQCHIRIPISVPIRTPNPMATLYYAELFTLNGVRFRFQSQLRTTGMESESESGSVNVNKP